MIKSTVSGIVKTISVPMIEDGEINIFVKEGDEIRNFTNCNDAIGEVFVRAKSIEACNKRAEEILNNIKINI